jgi:hypothetical protein
MNAMEQGLDRLAATVEPMTHKQRAEYLFLALAILGSNAPDVLAFILDRADERMSA